MTFLRVATFTIPILFFLIFSMPDVGAIVPNDIERVECTDIDQIPRSECNALVDLYEEMNGEEWNNNENWRKTDEPCDWHGITCDEFKRHVTELILEGQPGNHFGLKGALPAEIGDLVYLQRIDFTYNELTTLPPEIGNLKQLEYLRLSDNFLESLPREIGLLTNLKEIYLCDNKLQYMPREIGNLSSLTKLYFDHNELHEVPSEVGNLSNVETVRFNHNNLTSLPESLGNLSKMTRFYINDNNLTSLPESFTELTPSGNLDVSDNQLGCPISYELENWLNRYDPDWRDTQTCSPETPAETPIPTSTPTATSTPPPSLSDPFEPDGSCRFSRSLRIGDSPQRHNFHQARDEDWLQVDLQEGVTYRLLASGIHDDARPEIEIHSRCDTLPVAGGPAFGNDNELIFTADSNQPYYVKIWNNNVNIFGQDITYEVSISLPSPLTPTPTESSPTSTPTESPSGDLAIIVTGHNDKFELQTHIFNAANRAYEVFLSGVTFKDRIRYLGIGGDPRGDGDGDGRSDIDTHATVASAKEAITEWPIGKVNSESHIFIYLMSHGLNDYMMVDGDNDQLRVEVLDEWLDELENRTGASIVVIYEACQSGSFITLPNSISKQGRVVITSTDAENNAYPSLRSGAHFSDAFFSALRWGKDMDESFEIGRNASLSTRQLQRPLLDDSGDGAYTRTDGTLAQNLRFPPPDLPDRPASVPILRIIQRSRSLDNTSRILQVRASDAYYVKMVWADIYPPNYDPPPLSADGVAPDPGVDSIELSDSDGDGIYEATYNNFSQVGTYRIVFYGHDMEGDAIMPTHTDITISNPTATPTDVDVDILTVPTPSPTPTAHEVYLPVVTH